MHKGAFSWRPMEAEMQPPSWPMASRPIWLSSEPREKSLAAHAAALASINKDTAICSNGSEASLVSRLVYSISLLASIHEDATFGHVIFFSRGSEDH